MFYEMAATIWREEGISVTEVSHTLSQQNYALRNIQMDNVMPAHKMGVILTTKAVRTTASKVPDAFSEPASLQQKA